MYIICIYIFIYIYSIGQVQFFEVLVKFVRANVCERKGLCERSSERERWCHSVSQNDTTVRRGAFGEREWCLSATQTLSTNTSCVRRERVVTPQNVFTQNVFTQNVFTQNVFTQNVFTQNVFTQNVL